MLYRLLGRFPININFLKFYKNFSLTENVCCNIKGRKEALATECLTLHTQEMLEDTRQKPHMEKSWQMTQGRDRYSPYNCLHKLQCFQAQNFDNKLVL